MEVADSTTLADEVRKAFGHIADMHRRLDDMNARLSERTDYESEAYAKLIDEVTTLSERIAMEESENHEAEMERTLTGLGFLRTDFDRPTSEFSGGWRMRIELAKLLLRHPDVLLLDEPTNHLDIESIQWLENFLMTKAQAVVLVSHDRAFIDNVTNRTIEISLGHIYDYAVNYSKFLELRKERIEQQQRAYANQQKMIQDTEESSNASVTRPQKAFRFRAVSSNLPRSSVSRSTKSTPPISTSASRLLRARAIIRSLSTMSAKHSVTIRYSTTPPSRSNEATKLPSSARTARESLRW